MKKDIYREWIEANSEEEATKAWCNLRDKGYTGSEIYIFRYEGNDGRFHREVYVFAR